MDPTTLQLTVGAGVDVEGGLPITFVSGRVASAETPAATMASKSVTLIGRRPAPTMLWARLTDAGSGVEVAFSSLSSQTLGSVGRSAPCSQVFDDPSGALGRGATCRWTGPTTLLVALGFTADAAGALQPTVPSVAVTADTSTVVPCGPTGTTTTLRLQPGVVRAVPGGLRSAPAHCVAVMFPLAPLAPIVSISAPERVGTCDDLYVDASGTVDPSGRTPTFAWTVMALNTEAASAPLLTTSPLGAASSASVLVLSPDRVRVCAPRNQLLLA